ncbi:MAG: DUF1573 domain-containing protein [Deltaproteobacteria bacterium]|nr:MAG: DUF1573 domain-containing protein [Deltaproteobacteria bacterium]
MLKRLIFSLVVVLMAGAMVSCGSEGGDTATAEARQSVTPNQDAANTPQPQPATPATQAPTGPTTSIAFEETEYDFGSIKSGEKVRHAFKFKNTGSEPLIISNAKGSCGCTVPSWPREPIPPGGEGEIMVEFNSKGKRGKQNKKVTLTANTEPPQSFLYIKGEVIPDQTQQQQKTTKVTQ